jgi:hypothetical protein
LKNNSDVAVFLIDLMDASIPSHTIPMPSMEERSDRSKYHILNIFLQGFVVTMVACTMLVLVYVACKVSRERRAAECPQGNHFHNGDVHIIREVFTVDPSSTAVQGGIDDGSLNHQITSKKDTNPVNITDNRLPEATVKDIALDQKL